MIYIRPLIISLAVIISAALISNAWKRSHQGFGTINVTGLASKDFTSDLIVWNASYDRRGNTTKEAYALLRHDATEVRSYLAAKGVKESEMVFSAVSIEKEYDYVNDGNNNQMQVFRGYKLSQHVQIESDEVDKIEQISRGVTELIDRDIELYSNAPEYYYTKLSDLKIKMLAEATTDARLRAEKIAESAGSDVGNLQNVDMGIFQITAQNSSEDYSWGGAFNTTSKYKTASITVKLKFLVK